MTSHNASLRIGTRGSRLALLQTGIVEKLLKEKSPDLRTETIIITTEGDVSGEPLEKISGTGIFTKELDRALMDGRIDMAVHSLKDLPTRMTAGILLAAVPKREAAGEAFLSNGYPRLDALPEGAGVGTGSPRRRAQLLERRPDLSIINIRGNVETRIRKLDEGKADAVILACAGLIRLGLAGRIIERLPVETFVPAPGQGALGITVRADDEKTSALAALAEDPSTARAVEAERAFLLHLGGGCKTPIACHAFFRGSRLEVHGFVAAADGSTVFRGKTSGSGEEAGELGKRLAETLLEDGAGSVLLREDCE